MYTIEKHQSGRPYPLGVTYAYDDTYFSAVMKNGIDCGLILYDKKAGLEERIPFSNKNKFGSIFCICIKNLDRKRYSYNFYDGGNIYTDPYAKIIHGHEKWGHEGSLLRGGFADCEYDWEEDQALHIPYEDSIFYCLNVRAFTMHASSKVKKKGTFRGIIEKIPYLKELGITGIELMPAYEFNEIEKADKLLTMEEAMRSFDKEKRQDSNEIKLNCWGYKEAFYFAPKSAFSSERDAVTEFRELVKALHKNGIEIIMQFYFPNSVKQGLILEVVKYWVMEYHIDGIHLKGERIPLPVIATEPLFTDTKLFYYDFPWEEIYRDTETPAFRNLAYYKDVYMYTIRKFLKGDENMVSSFLEMQRNNPAACATVNYVTNYYGFTLADMVSYERKNNRSNGEENRDGPDLNYTWNCGNEGPSRKKSVRDLRLRQIKNALTILFLSQGTPLIFSGDEIGNTRFGNNNPYCQDNETGWIKWNETVFSQSILQFTKSLISLKKKYSILHQREEMRILDYISCGYPDLSYHGEEAWRPELNHYSRHAAMMYCGMYVKKEKDNSNYFFYIAYNMHWITHTFALPNLPKGMKWCLIADTGLSDTINITKVLPKEEKEQNITVAARTVQIYISKQEEGQTEGSLTKRPLFRI